MSDQDGLRRYRAAADRVDQAQDEAHAVMEEVFPVGALVTYLHGGRERHGEVTMHGYGTDLRLLTPNDVQVWIGAGRVTRIDRLPEART